MEYVVYLDESVSEGEFFSDFYGGVVVALENFDFVRNTIDKKKEELSLLGEIKWTKVTDNYLEKYKAIVDTFFSLIQDGKIKMRVMFRSNAIVPSNLTVEQKRNRYHLLYYQFVKHAFGFSHCNPDHESDVFLRLYFDRIPDTTEQNEEFKAHIIGLQSLRSFQQARIKIRQDDIVEIDSKAHSIQQCMDIVLGAIAFRLNNLNERKLPGTNKRGKRTIAKEKLYKHILSHIRQLGNPFFNIGISTGMSSAESRWVDPYRHWCFTPHEFTIDETRFKRRK